MYLNELKGYKGAIHLADDGDFFYCGWEKQIQIIEEWAQLRFVPGEGL
jgi:hypothetical protein